MFLSTHHIKAISINQIIIAPLESSIAAYNPIPFMDTFVEHIDLRALDF